MVFIVMSNLTFFYFFFQAEDGIRDLTVTGVQTCALPIWLDGELRLGVGLPGETPREIKVSLGRGAVESPFAAMTYAGLKVNELDADYRLNRGEILRLG